MRLLVVLLLKVTRIATVSQSCLCCSVVAAGGLPDLLLWRVADQSVKMVEVKGPRDRLSHQQRFWLAHMANSTIQVGVLHCNWMHKAKKQHCKFGSNSRRLLLQSSDCQLLDNMKLLHLLGAGSEL